MLYSITLPCWCKSLHRVIPESPSLIFLCSSHTGPLFFPLSKASLFEHQIINFRHWEFTICTLNLKTCLSTCTPSVNVCWMSETQILSDWFFNKTLSEWVKVAQSCLTICHPMDYTVHGILQVRVLEWVAFPFSRGSSQPRDRTQASHIAGRLLTSLVSKIIVKGLSS